MVTNDRIKVGADLVLVKTCSLVYFKQQNSFQQVLGLGWVYLATEGIISLADFAES